MTLAQSIKNGQTLRMKAGAAAIARNDLVLLGGLPPQLYPVQTSDYAVVAAAGAAAVAATTYTGFPSNAETRERAVIDPDTSDIFIADSHRSAAPSGGCTIWKYNALGALLRTVELDGDASTTTTSQIARLTNGNLLVVWRYIGAPYSIFFAILDKNLAIVVPKTTLATVSTNPQAKIHAVAIAGGGFAFAYAHANVGSYFGVRDASGAAVYGPTLIAGAPTNASTNDAGPRFRLAVLSNGNIFVGIHDTYFSGGDGARYCIFTPTGGVVKGYTALTGYGNSYTGNDVPPEIDVLNGFVCMAIPSQRFYVFNNAGTLQGAPAQVMQGNNTVRVKSDGTQFWVFSGSGSAAQVSRVQTSGAYVTSALPGVLGVNADVIYDRGQWAIFYNSTYYILAFDANVLPSVLQSGTFGTLGTSLQVIGGIGDFCALSVASGKFQIVKLLNASIVGIAQNDVAAGNAGTLVSVNPGAGAYPTNECKGNQGKTFDHSAAPIAGNKGALFLNSVSLKGI